MQRIESLEDVETKPVWSVKDFAKRHHLTDIEEARLLQLFGAFATASELLHNAQRQPRWR